MISDGLTARSANARTDRACFHSPLPPQQKPARRWFFSPSSIRFFRLRDLRRRGGGGGREPGRHRRRRGRDVAGRTCGA